MSWFSRRTPLAEARWVVIDCETSGLAFEPLAHAVFPQRKLRTLDDWLAACHIHSGGRHDALHDALAAAELLLVLLARARSDGMRTVEELLSTAGKIPL